ncbi:MAG: hypothetical protein ACLQNE_18575 [Thermoguttaceae bacterium]
MTEQLERAGAVGVWGNHDIGLCANVGAELRRQVDPRVLAFMGRLRPSLEFENCHFSHVEPWLDARDILQLWYYDGPPETAEQAARSFAAVPHRLIFVGHFHRWVLVTPEGRTAWNGQVSICLKNWGRCLVVIAPVSAGHCAVLDTGRMELTPLNW